MCCSQEHDTITFIFLFCQHFWSLRHEQCIYFVRNTQAQARAFPLLFIIV